MSFLSSRVSIKQGSLTTARASTHGEAEGLTPEEEEVLAQMLEQRKAKRKADISEHKRRSKFDPLAAAEKRKAAAAAHSGIPQDEAKRQGNPSASAPTIRPKLSDVSAASASTTVSARPAAERPSPSSGAAPSVSPSAARPGSSPRGPLFAALADEPEELDGDDDGIGDVDEAEFEAAALAFLREEAEAAKSVTLGSTSPAPPSASLPARPRTFVAPGAFKPGSSRGAVQPPSAPLKLGPASPTAPRAAPRVQPASPSSAGSGTPMPQRKPQSLASKRRAGSAPNLASLTRGLDLSALEGLSKEQLEAILADDLDDDDDDGAGSKGGVAGEAEELDWDTLAAGESFEKYLSELQSEAEDQRVKRARSTAAASRSGGDAAQGGAKPGAGKAQTLKQQITALPADELASAGEDAEAAEDAEFDQLLKLFEMVEEDSEATAPAAGRQQGGGDGQTAAAGGAKRTGKAKEIEEDIDWAVLEKMFLGDGWDREITEMAEKVRLEVLNISASG